MRMLGGQVEVLQSRRNGPLRLGRRRGGRVLAILVGPEGNALVDGDGNALVALVRRSEAA